MHMRAPVLTRMDRGAVKAVGGAALFGLPPCAAAFFGGALAGDAASIHRAAGCTMTVAARQTIEITGRTTFQCLFAAGRKRLSHSQLTRRGVALPSATAHRHRLELAGLCGRYSDRPAGGRPNTY